MTIAYLDTSALVAIAFGEPGGATLARRLRRFDQCLSANLLEAELRAACAREDVAFVAGAFDWIKWVLPDRPLSPELEGVFARGYVRGADAWHLACALYVAEDPRRLAFITLDARQRAVARQLGFPT